MQPVSTDQMPFLKPSRRIDRLPPGSLDANSRDIREIKQSKISERAVKRIDGESAIFPGKISLPQQFLNDFVGETMVASPTIECLQRQSPS